MNQEEIIHALSDLTNLMSTFDTHHPIIQQNFSKNQWFTIDNQMFAIDNWKKQLTSGIVTEFATQYKFNSNPKMVGIIMAGNVPLVGFHDLICVLLSGNIAQVKLSKDDEILPKFIINYLITNFTGLKERIIIVDKLVDYQAAIATGSNNSSRYFDYYFRDVPHIIRKNRTSVAVITNSSSAQELFDLSNDVFRYFGLGCRNIGKIYLPTGYSIPTLLDQWNHWLFLADHNKYINNYTYHKALFLMNLEHHYDNGFLTLVESEGLFSPLGCLFYQFYEDEKQLEKYLIQEATNIQCVVGKGEKHIPFGKAQHTRLQDFADGVDTMKFLESI